MLSENANNRQNRLGKSSKEFLSFDKYVAERNTAGARLGALLGAVLMPSGVILDWLTLNEELHYFIMLRALASCGCLLIVVASYATWAQRHPFLLGLAPVMVCAVVFEAMIVRLGGYPSAYYAGLVQLILAVGVLFYWTLGEAVLGCTALIALWLVGPPLAGLDFADAGLFFTNFYALLISAVIAVASNAGRYTAVRREQIARHKLATTSADLAEALEAAKEVDKLKSEFFANISHELRTPLTLIIAPVDELLASLQPSRERDVLKVVRRNASRLLRMIDDLLDLARLEAGGLRLQVREFDLSETAERVAENAQRAAEARGITFTFDSQADKGEMYGDPHRIEIVLTNLIGNAVKFTPDNGRIEVRVRSDEDGATTEVEDTGPGIPKDALDKVFERFFQVQGSERRRHGGAGIGLALAKELAELHGGALTVTSEPGQGATFKLFIPWGRSHFENDVMERRQVQVTAHPGRRAEDRLSSVPPSATAIALQAVGPQANGNPILLDGGRRAKILVAEDEEDLREFIVSSLSRDFDVRAARDGAEALKLLAEERPDLVLTDIMMPNTSGFDLCRAIKDDPMLKHVPVILLTARGESETALEGFGVGADDFVAKPFHPQVLGARIRAHLENRALSLRLTDQARLASAGTLAAGLAHEVKNPINAIVNAARVLKAGGSGKVSNDKLLQVVIEGVERINSIVSVIERHARPADGTELVACNVQDGIESTLELLQHRLHEVTVHRDFQLAEAVSAPARALNQVLMNLLDNAILSGAKNLWIELGQQADRVVVAVADDGPGVPQDLVQRIFDPFFTTRREGEGTGLGLHLSRRIAKDCGGELRYEPRPGGGARFVMEIPAMERAA